MYRFNEYHMLMIFFFACSAPQVLYTVALLAVAVAASSTESQKSTAAAAAAAPSPVQPMTTYPGAGGIIPYPPHLQSNQFAAEYAGPLARSSFGPKAIAPSSAFSKSRRQ